MTGDDDQRETSGDLSQRRLLVEHRDSPGLMLALLGHEAMRRLREAHTSYDLSPRQFQILGLLHDDGPVPQGELALALHTAPSVLVTLLNPLDAAGLVTRHRDPSDRRRHLVVLTDAGRERVDAASKAQRDVEATLFASLTEAQRDQLGILLAVVRDDLTGGDESCATPGSLADEEPQPDTPADRTTTSRSS